MCKLTFLITVLGVSLLFTSETVVAALPAVPASSDAWPDAGSAVSPVSSSPVFSPDEVSAVDSICLTKCAYSSGGHEISGKDAGITRKVPRGKNDADVANVVPE